MIDSVASVPISAQDEGDDRRSVEFSGDWILTEN